MEIELEQTKVTETLQQSSAAVKEKEELSEKVKNLEREKLSLLYQYQDVESSKSAEIAELKVNLDSLQRSIEEMRENSLKLNEEKAQLEQQYEDVLSTKSNVENSYQQTLVSLEKLSIVEQEKHELEEENSKQRATNESLNEQVNQKTFEYEALEIKLNEHLEASGKEVESLKHQMQENEEKFQVSLGKHFYFISSSHSSCWFVFHGFHCTVNLRFHSTNNL